MSTSTEKELALLRIAHLKLATSEESFRLEAEKLRSAAAAAEARESKLRDLCRVLQKKATEAEAEGKRLGIEETSARSAKVEQMVSDVQAKLSTFSADAAKTAAENENIKTVNTLLEKRHASELNLKELEAKILTAKMEEANARADALSAQNEELKKLLAEAATREDAIKEKIDALFNAQEKRFVEGMAGLQKEVETRTKLLTASREREDKAVLHARETEKALVTSLTNEKNRLIELTKANQQIAKLTSLCRALQTRQSSVAASASGGPAVSTTSSTSSSSDASSSSSSSSSTESLTSSEQDSLVNKEDNSDDELKNMNSEINDFRKKLTVDFLKAGIKQSVPVLVHSSLKSLGTDVPGGADTVIDALLDAIGPEGTLVIPTLSYLFVHDDKPIFDVVQTPTNLGAIPEAFRRRKGVVRSMHPTHSCCAFGAQAIAITSSHVLDRSPVGSNSPFSKVRDMNGQVVFLGCGARCNTSIHGVEETLAVQPLYLLRDSTTLFTLRDENGIETQVEHKRHDFSHTNQRYERLVDLLRGTDAYSFNETINGAIVHVFDAKRMWQCAFDELTRDPSSLTEEATSDQREWHHLVESKGIDGKNSIFKYRVGPPSV
jgi:aminoglycoside 3-N-acetyltransferase